MSKNKSVLAIDLGATIGKVVKVAITGKKLEISYLMKFPTGGTTLTTINGRYKVWNIVKFYETICEIVEHTNIESIGIDSWGVDFALLDKRGRMLTLPQHYRDVHSQTALEKALEILGEEVLYKETGVKPMHINSLFRLYQMVLEQDPLIYCASKFVMIPDLLHFWLSGSLCSEHTIASTSQCYSLPLRKWAYKVLEALNVPVYLFPELVGPGTYVGNFKGDKRIKVIVPASHDTSSAVAAIPFDEPAIFISCGTWAIIGIEHSEPVLCKEAMRNGFTNEGGISGILFIKNATGMWLLDECNRCLKLDFETLSSLAVQGRTFAGFIDPDDSMFFYEGNMIDKINIYLCNTNQEPLSNPKDIVRLVLENLAFNYRFIIENLEKIIGLRSEKIYLIGGGAKNVFLNQSIADALQRPVVACPWDGAAVGNALSQLISLKEVSNIEEGRQLIRESLPIKTYYPNFEERIAWEEAYEKWKKITRGRFEEGL